jgi:hypothetical protein
MHFIDLVDGDADFNKLSPKYNVDYSYGNGHHANGESEYTLIFTPDNYDYSRF